MPLLDVSDVLLDPLFNEQLTVIRRTEIVDNEGVASFVEQTLHPTGVVTQGNPQSVARAPDYTAARGNILVHAYNFVLRDPSTGLASDIVVWQGERYTVQRTYDWSTYGKGFTVAECELQPTVKA